METTIRRVLPIRQDITYWFCFTGAETEINKIKDDSKIKREKNINRRVQRHIVNVCHVPDPPSFSLPTTFLKLWCTFRTENPQTLKPARKCIGVLLDCIRIGFNLRWRFKGEFRSYKDLVLFNNKCCHFSAFKVSLWQLAFLFFIQPGSFFFLQIWQSTSSSAFLLVKLWFGCGLWVPLFTLRLHLTGEWESELALKGQFSHRNVPAESTLSEPERFFGRKESFGLLFYMFAICLLTFCIYGEPLVL